MEVEFVRSTLAAQFSIAASVAPKSSPKDVLKYVKMVATRDGVFLFATDSENGIRIKCNGILSASPGECLLPVDRMTLILRESTDETLKVSTLGDTIHVRGRKSKHKIQAVPPGEFPAFVEPSKDKTLQVVGADFCRITKRVHFAYDDETKIARFALKSVRIIFSDNKLSSFASDGRMIATDSCECVTSHSNRDAFTLIQPTSLPMIWKAFADVDESVTVAVSPSSLYVIGENVEVFCRLLEGRTPDFESYLKDFENRNGTKISIDPVEFTSALKQIRVSTSAESMGTVFETCGNLVTLRSQTAQVGESEVELPIEISGDNVKFTFDPAMALDLLKAIPNDEKIVVNAVNDHDPIYISSTPTHRCLLCPMVTQ